MLCPFGAEELFTLVTTKGLLREKRAFRSYMHVCTHMRAYIFPRSPFLKSMAEAERRLAGTEASGLPEKLPSSGRGVNIAPLRSVSA